MNIAPIAAKTDAARFVRGIVCRKTGRWWLAGLVGGVCAACASPPPPARPAPPPVRWRGDMETGGLGQWGYLLNARGVSVVSSPVAQGRYAARVELRPDDLWPNGLNRVELEHKPAPDTVGEGRQTFFAWSLFVPAALSASRHQIGYWESYPSYRQIMALEARGRALAFVTRLPEEQVHWTASDALTPNVWHRVVMRVGWSVDPAQGFVDVWFDGAPVVVHAGARTLWDAPNFVHVGLLRDRPEPTEVMFVDAAVEAASLPAVWSAGDLAPAKP